MKTGFEVLEYNSVRDGIMKYREQGAIRGVYLGYPPLEPHYTMSLPGCTDWTGIPQSGKTEFLMQCLLNTSTFYGWKHFLYVPDIGDKNEIVANIIHKITGKTFDKKYKNHITEQEVERQLHWVMNHFRILTKVDLKQKITPYEFWDMAAAARKEWGCQTATIDSWKDMKHDMSPFSGFVDRYLEDVLSYRNEMAEAHRMHFHTIVHPLKTEKDSSGHRKPPGAYDLKGGTEWYNNGKCMITVHRPDGLPNAARIFITKAKPKSVAKQGTVDMYFDVKECAFYYDNGNGRNYAKKDFNPEIGIDFEETNQDDLPF